jgi:hypothetical protein
VEKEAKEMRCRDKPTHTEPGKRIPDWHDAWCWPLAPVFPYPRRLVAARPQCARTAVTIRISYEMKRRTTAGAFSGNSRA